MWVVNISEAEGCDLLREMGKFPQFGHLKVKKLKDRMLIAAPEDVSSEFIQHVQRMNPSIEMEKVSPDLFRKFPTTPHCKLKMRLEHILRENQMWDETLMEDIPKHWEKHGDMVILPHTAFSNSIWTQPALDSCLWNLVGKTLGCKRIAKRHKIQADGYRTPKIELLKGENGWVRHIDNGIRDSNYQNQLYVCHCIFRYEFDVTKCMFSAGNITEKLRVASMNCSGEVIVDLYAGIGYFTIPFLVHTAAAHVHACEWNEAAVEALRRNLQTNGVEERCTIHFGDNRNVCPMNVANRVNLGLLPSSRSGWETACKALLHDQGGTLHVHENVNSMGCQKKPDWMPWANGVAADIKAILKDVHNREWSVSVHHVECVKSYAPRVFHMVVDLNCKPLG